MAWVPRGTSIQSVGFYVSFPLVRVGGRKEPQLKKFSGPSCRALGSSGTVALLLTPKLQVAGAAGHLELTH